MSNTNTNTEASAVLVASKTPSTFSSCDTARVVSRKLRKAGFPIFKDGTRTSRSVDGYWIRREGSGSRVAISYFGHNAYLRVFEVREKESLAFKFLRDCGYTVDDKGYIQCQVSF